MDGMTNTLLFVPPLVMILLLTIAAFLFQVKMGVDGIYICRATVYLQSRFVD